MGLQLGFGWHWIVIGRGLDLGQGLVQEPWAGLGNGAWPGGWWGLRLDCGRG